MRTQEFRGSNYTWKYEDVYEIDHHGSSYTIFSKAYLHENVTTDLHAHEFYEINIVADGTGYHTINGKRLQTGKGYVYVITPGVKHILTSSKNLNVFHILLNNYFLTKYKSELEVLPGFYSLFNQNFSKPEQTSFIRLDDEQLNSILNYCNLLVNEQQADNSHSGVICNNLVITIIAKLSRIISEMNKVRTPDNKELSIVRVMDYINTHYADDIDIKTLTTLSLYSKTCFMKYFKMYCGETPLKYLYSVRAKKAKEKIENGLYDIAFVANECGFFDSSHLNKHFKLNFGITPKQYINEIKRQNRELKSDKYTPPPGKFFRGRKREIMR